MSRVAGCYRLFLLGACPERRFGWGRFRWGDAFGVPAGAPFDLRGRDCLADVELSARFPGGEK